MSQIPEAAVPLHECPIGMFLSLRGVLCLKTEYGDNNGRIDAYIVESGEFFWGGTSKPTDQREVLVTPVDVVVVEAAPHPPAPDAAVEAMARALCLADNANPDSVQPVTAAIGYANGGSDHRMAYRLETAPSPPQWTFYKWKAEQVIKHLAARSAALKPGSGE